MIALALLLTPLAFAGEGHFAISPADYTQTGLHASLIQTYLECTQPPTQLADLSHKLHCLDRLVGCATALPNWQAADGGRPLGDLLRSFAATDAPEHWDSHVGRLKIILDKLTGHSDRRDVPNPGLWSTCTHQALKTAQSISQLTRAHDALLLKALSDLRSSGAGFLANLVNHATVPTFHLVAEQAFTIAGRLAQEIALAYRKDSERRGYDYLSPINAYPREQLGRVARTLEPCDPSAPNSMELPRFPLSPKAISILRAHLPVEALLASDLGHPWSPQLCYHEVGFRPAGTKVIASGRRQYHAELSGHFGLSLRVAVARHLVFAARIEKKERETYAVIFREWREGAPDRITKEWNRELEPDRARALSTRWISLHTAWENALEPIPQSPEIQSSLALLREEIIKSHHLARQEFRQHLPPTVTAIAQEFEGIHKAFRTLALIRVPLSFQHDSKIRTAIATPPLPVTAQQILTALDHDDPLLADLAHLKWDRLTAPIEALVLELERKLSPELNSQNIPGIHDTLEELVAQEKEILKLTAGIPIMEALVQLKEQMAAFARKRMPESL
ncbi:MAG: hypothetical protein HYR96_05405 [Deltaproteobacteria bacterium]|nr:hypothetical protein [Deltaproteobacteria bacterium]MBI3295596.1 hypothetical protein [Deltaproteobacteria bacterium]